MSHALYVTRRGEHEERKEHGWRCSRVSSGDSNAQPLPREENAFGAVATIRVKDLQ
jgi:hypothetical protein